jgi:hypothetical protein
MTWGPQRRRFTAMTDLDGRTANVFGGIAEQPNAALQQRRCYLPQRFPAAPMFAGQAAIAASICDTSRFQ